ncbi:MAG: serine hydrolase [Hyphomicrobiales bacterium]
MVRSVFKITSTQTGLVLSFATILWSASAQGYPLDGYPTTGILRLEAYRLAQQGRVRGPQEPKGALLGLDQVDIRLARQQGLALPAADPQLNSAIASFLGEDSDRYGIAVLDLSDPENLRYGEIRGSYRANPGSVGKLMVVLAVFQALADIYPDDVPARLAVLKNAMVTADEFIISDHHEVPLWAPGDPAIQYRRLQIGDRANLWSYLDWMLSASSNAAASMVIRELMLLVHFGKSYPVQPEQSKAFFQKTSKRELSELLSRALVEPVARNGLNPEELRQGSFFTARGKQIVPGTSSYATPRELLHYLVRLEQGRIVDEASSREIKRLLYMTQRRIRYASSPALVDAAVYFKSGSLFRCAPEPGYVCRQYEGNLENMMNSVAIVEAPAGTLRLHYLVVMMSNVLRKNSAVEHQSFATRLHRLIEGYHGGASPKP